MVAAGPKTRSAVLAVCTVSPSTAQLRSSPVPASSAVTSSGPNGVVASERLALQPLQGSVLPVPGSDVVEYGVAGDRRLGDVRGVVDPDGRRSSPGRGMTGATSRLVRACSGPVPVSASCRQPGSASRAPTSGCPVLDRVVGVEANRACRRRCGWWPDATGPETCQVSCSRSAAAAVPDTGASIIDRRCAAASSRSRSAAAAPTVLVCNQTASSGIASSNGPVTCSTAGPSVTIVSTASALSTASATVSAAAPPEPAIAAAFPGSRPHTLTE